jgi:tetratricopeptide (TPR) repeat protein
VTAFRDVGCPTDDTLGALVHRALDPDDLVRVAAHLDSCAACQQIAIAAVREGLAPTGAVGTPSGVEVLGTMPAYPVIARPPAGGRFGRYELRVLLGAGGMGAVYDAHDPELDRAVALKVLRPELSEVPGLTARLLHESRLMARIAHPSVITVYDVGHVGDAAFIAMELVRGSTLTGWLAAHPLDWRAIVSIFERAGQGLAAAHGAGIVHRDFKPDNVLVSHDGHKVVVTDFGIAREAMAEAEPASESALPHATMATDGAVIGTPAYMAPEQIAARQADRRADVFAFSVALWEALFGVRPFRGASLAEIREAMRRPLSGPPPGARRVPRRLVRVLARGLEVDPRDRWDDMPAMLGALAAIRTMRKRASRAIAVAGALGVCAAAAVMFARAEPPLDRCASALTAFDAAYNPARAASVAAALAAAPELQRAVVTTLDRDAEQWRQAARATCRADREVIQPPTTTACLDARRIELAGSVDDLIAGGPAATKYAAALSELVSPPSLCAAPPPGLLFARVPADPAVRRQVTALRERLQDIRELRDRGNYAEARAQVAPIAAAAKPLWPSVYAEARFTVGTIDRDAGNPEVGVPIMIEAAELAEAAHDDPTAVAAWVDVAEAAAIDQGEFPRALEYIARATTAADRIGRPADLMLGIEYVKGGVLMRTPRRAEAEAALKTAVELAAAQGKPALVGMADLALGELYATEERYADAAATFRRAIDQAPRSASGEYNGLAVVFERLAGVLALLGDRADAEIEMRRAIEIEDRTLAATELQRQHIRVLYAWLLLELGRPTEALAGIDGAVAVIARTQGTHSHRYGEALVDAGELRMYLRRREAHPMLERACDILAFIQGVDHPDHAECEIYDATALAGLHRDADALAKLNHAIPLVAKAYGEAHLRTANALRVRGTVVAALGHRDEAFGDLDRAIAILSTKQVEPGYLATAKWHHGQLRADRDPTGGIAEVADAVALFKTANGRWAVERADATAWLAHHTRPTHRR